MHVSHKPFLPVWTPAAPAPKESPSDTTEFVEIARIAEDLGEGARRGGFARSRQGRAPRSRREAGVTDPLAPKASCGANWSPSPLAVCDLTTISAMEAGPHGVSPIGENGARESTASEKGLSLGELLSRITTAG
jgi:hypothetical protein